MPEGQIRKRPTPDEIWSALCEVRDECYPMLKMGNVRIEISDRLKKVAAKVCWIPSEDRFVVTVSGRYFDEFGWHHELSEVLKHEIIHIARPRAGHSKIFAAERDRLGAIGYCRSPGDRKKKLLLECQNDTCSWIYSSLERDPCPKCGENGRVVGTVEE